MPAPLEEEQRRKAVAQGYLTHAQKDEALALAATVGMTLSDIIRLFLVTATPEDIERLKNHPAYLSMLLEEGQR